MEHPAAEKAQSSNLARSTQPLKLVIQIPPTDYAEPFYVIKDPFHAWVRHLMNQGRTVEQITVEASLSDASVVLWPGVETLATEYRDVKFTVAAVIKDKDDIQRETVAQEVGEALKRTVGKVVLQDDLFMEFMVVLPSEAQDDVEVRNIFFRRVNTYYNKLVQDVLHYVVVFAYQSRCAGVYTMINEQEIEAIVNAQASLVRTDSAVFTTSYHSDTDHSTMSDIFEVEEEDGFWESDRDPDQDSDEKPVTPPRHHLPSSSSSRPLQKDTFEHTPQNKDWTDDTTSEQPTQCMVGCAMPLRLVSDFNQDPTLRQVSKRWASVVPLTDAKLPPVHTPERKTNFRNLILRLNRLGPSVTVQHILAFLDHKFVKWSGNITLYNGTPSLWHQLLLHLVNYPYQYITGLTPGMCICTAPNHPPQSRRVAHTGRLGCTRHVFESSSQYKISRAEEHCVVLSCRPTRPRSSVFDPEPPTIEPPWLTRRRRRRGSQMLHALRRSLPPVSQPQPTAVHRTLGHRSPRYRTPTTAC